MAEIRGGEAPPPPEPAPGARRRLHTDAVVALAILAFCAGVFALTQTFDTVPAALAQGMGPAAFPRLLLAVMALLALVLALTARGRADETREQVPSMVYWTAAAMAAFMALLWAAGMAVAMAVAVIGMGALWGERRWPLLVASGVGLSLSIYVVFTKAFGIPLPRGLLGEWLF
jgi:putative tricarboxylic transport membrane protein